MRNDTFVRTRRQKQILLVFGLVLVVALALCAILIPPSPPDPIYDGKPLSYWLTRDVVGIEYIAGTGWVHKSHPVDTNALPFLVNTLNRSDNVFRKFYGGLWRRSPAWLKNRLPASSTITTNVQVNASNMLRHLGDDARPAIPALVRMLEPHRDIQLRTQVTYLLGDIGKGDPVARQALINSAQNDPDLPLRRAARDSLGKLDPAAAANLPTNKPSTLK